MYYAYIVTVLICMYINIFRKGSLSLHYECISLAKQNVLFKIIDQLSKFYLGKSKLRTPYP